MQITNKNNYPKPIVAAVQRPPHKVIPKRYSVTSLLNPPTQVVLNRRHSHEVEQDVADMVWALTGSAFHQILEDGAKTPELSYLVTEKKITMEMDGCTVSGILDLYDPKTNTISDYKTTSVWTGIKGDFEKYRNQLLIYAYMMTKQGFKVERIEAVLYYRDFSKTKARFDKDYPKVQIQTVGWKVTEAELKWAEDFLRDQLRTIQIFEDLPDDRLPACPPEDRWNEGTKYKVKRKGKTKALRVLDSYEEADRWIAEKGLSDDKAIYIDVKEGRDRRCEEYCSVCEFCRYYANSRES